MRWNETCYSTKLNHRFVRKIAAKPCEVEVEQRSNHWGEGEASSEDLATASKFVGTPSLPYQVFNAEFCEQIQIGQNMIRHILKATTQTTTNCFFSMRSHFDDFVFAASGVNATESNSTTIRISPPETRTC